MNLLIIQKLKYSADNYACAIAQFSQNDFEGSIKGSSVSPADTVYAF